MEIIIIRFTVTYLLIATFILLNFMFNKKIKFYFKHKETGEIIYPSSILLIGISFYWIITLPLLLLIREKE